MVSKPEFSAASTDILNTAKATEEDLLLALKDTPSIPKALGIAKTFGADYYKSFDEIFTKTLQDAALNSSNYYNAHFGLGLKDAELKKYSYDLIDQLRGEKYYGLDYQQRITLLNLSLNKRFAKSSSVGYNLTQKLRNITRALTEPYPFGAHSGLDKRFLLSEIVRMEHTMAKEMAKRAGVDLIKWNLSSNHNHVDLCDEYAAAVSKEVVIFLQENGMQGVDPHGLYMADQVPRIPHPNCQCELSGVGMAHSTLNRPQTRRSMKRIMGIVEKLLRR